MNYTWAKWGFEIYGHLSDSFGDKMANLSPIDFKIGLYIKVNVNKGKNIFEVHNISKHFFKDKSNGDNN